MGPFISREIYCGMGLLNAPHYRKIIAHGKGTRNIIIIMFQWMSDVDDVRSVVKLRQAGRQPATILLLSFKCEWNVLTYFDWDSFLFLFFLQPLFIVIRVAKVLCSSFQKQKL